MHSRFAGEMGRWYSLKCGDGRGLLVDDPDVDVVDFSCS